MDSNSRKAVRTGRAGGFSGAIQGKMVVPLCAVMIMMLGPLPAWAVGGDFTINFVAAGPLSYDHATGNFAHYGAGIVGDTIVNSLQGGDFYDGDVVSWLALITVRTGATPNNQKIQLDFAFAAGNTGHIGASIAGVNPPIINSDVAASDYYDSAVVEAAIATTSTGTSTAGFVDGKGPRVEGKNLVCSIWVDNLNPGDKVVLRIDTPLSLDPLESPTGNLYGQLAGGTVIEPSTLGKAATISTGQQTVPFQKVSEIHPADVRVDKKVQNYDEGGSFQDSLTVAHHTQVKYSFTLTNPGQSALLNVVLMDNDGTSSFPVTLTTGLTDEDGDGSADDLAVGASATGEYGPVTLTNPRRDSTAIPVTDTATATGTDYTGQARRSPPDSVTVTVNPLGNQDPSAVDDSYSTNQGTALNVPAPGVLVNDSDPDAGDTLSVNVSTSDSTSAHGGTVSLQADGAFSYAPPTGYVGDDTFRYTMTDGYGGTDSALVTIHVANRAPVATDDAYSTPHDTTLTVDSTDPTKLLLANDHDPDAGDTLSIDVSASDSTSAQGGTVSLHADGTFSYAPPAGYVGDDTFNYTITDAHGATDPAIVTIHITNQAPVPADDQYSTMQGKTIIRVGSAEGVLANDQDDDGDDLTVSLVADKGPTHGTLNLDTDGSFTYRPDNGFAGIDTFSYRVSDGNGGQDTADVILIVNAKTSRRISVDLEVVTLTYASPSLSGGFTITNTSAGRRTAVTIDEFSLVSIRYMGLSDIETQTWHDLVLTEDVSGLTFDPASVISLAGGDSATVTFECSLANVPEVAAFEVEIGAQVEGR
jgi:VCBS repeat-containing protein